uniref:Uncharacterized protein n=1 Tax=Fagus sylvatica TaxID=28930 RepID=A0A2N9HB34_FAGSY
MDTTVLINPCRCMCGCPESPTHLQEIYPPLALHSLGDSNNTLMLVIWSEGCCLDSGGEGSCVCCVDSGCGGIGHSVDWEGMIGRCHPNGDMGCCGSVEKTKLREGIVARRQKKLIMRRARQKYLEEAALREAELLQELDRERAAEVEKEVERQRLLELERAKTKELRHNLDLEKERQTQRELQRELELAESGLRTSRRDFSSSSHSSRPRDRYRERENGRSGNEGSTRISSGSLQPETSATSTSMGTMPTVVLSGSRQFSGQLPTILQSRDRLDECASSYEENLDGSKDSGDTGSVGDPDLVSAFDVQSGGFGSAQRHGSRGSKSRQVQVTMATLRNLKIKTGTCKRLVKELHSYEEEVEREASKTADMKEKGADPYDLKQQENVLAESRMMIPDCRKRLEASLADLKGTLAELEESNQKEGPEIVEAKSTIVEVEQLFQTTET